MSTAYHDRFAAALRKALPSVFEVEAHDGWNDVSVNYGTARLLGYMPNGDKRAAVTAEDVSEWIERAASKLRSQMHHYTPEAKQAARALLERLEPATEAVLA